MAMQAILGGNDVTVWCQTLAHAPELNLASFAEIQVPSDQVSFSEGDELVIVDGGSTVHAGPATFGEDTGDADSKFSTIQSHDALAFWDRRQVMDGDGDYSDPSIIEDFEDACSIMGQAITNSITVDGAMGVSVGTVDGTGPPLLGYKPTDWPMTLDQLREFLVNTGRLDLHVNHASGGGSTVDLYKGDYGADLSGSVVFDYATGSFNCSSARYTFDFSKTISRIRYFLGPKRPQYDGDIQHWAGDVQIDDPALDVGDFATLQPTIEGLSSGVEGLLWLLRRIEIHDANGDENSLRDLYMHMWQSDMFVNARPRRLLTVTPNLGEAPAFTCGDVISVSANLRDSHSGPGRVYSYRKEQDVDGNVFYASVTTSADQET